MASRTNQDDLVTQPTEDKAVIRTDAKDSKPENQFLVSGLFSALENDQDLAEMVKVWPELPEHIKVTIMTLIQAHKENK